LERWITENISVSKCEKSEKVGRRFRRERDEVLCRTGEAVWTPVFSEDERLGKMFSEGVIHTVAPYNSDPDRDSVLQSCYYNSLHLASQLAQPRPARVVTALLATGVKEVSLETSSKALARALAQLQSERVAQLEIVIQPGPDTASQIDAVCHALQLGHEA